MPDPRRQSYGSEANPRLGILKWGLLSLYELFDRIAEFLRRKDWQNTLIALCLGVSAPASVLGKAGGGVFFGIAAIAALLQLFRLREAWGTFRPLAGFAGVVLTLAMSWWLVSSVLSIDPTASISVWARMILFLAAAGILTCYLSIRPKLLPSVVKTLVVSGIVFYGYGAIATYLPAWTKPLELVRATQTDPTAYFKASASVAAMCIPVFIWAGLRFRGLWLFLSWTAIIPALVLIFGDGRSLSRSALIGMLGALAFVVLIHIASKCSRLVGGIATVAVILIGLIAGATAIWNLPDQSEIEASNGNSALMASELHRQAIWGFVRDRALEKPVFGYGINTINTVSGAKKEVLNLNQEYVPAHPHNWVLEVASETGFPGLFLFGVAVLIFILRYASRYRENPLNSAPVLACSAVFFVSSLSNFSFWAAWWQVSFLTILSITVPIAALPPGESGPAAPHGRGRGGIVLAGTYVVVICALLFVVWGARRHDEGRILYKRLSANSEYKYDEISPVYLETDPAALISIRTTADATRVREALVEVIWGESTIPNRATDVTISDVTNNPPYNFSIWWPDGIERIERVVIPFEYGYNAIGYILTPKESNNRGLVYAHGYAGDISQAAKHARSALYQGYTIALMNFPGYGENHLSEFVHPRFGYVPRDHDLILSVIRDPLRYYIEPLVALADDLRDRLGMETVDVSGFSAGGWAATVAAAVDARFRRSVSVAGVLPLYLRLSDRRNQWPPPHLYPPLLQTANYLEMFVLAGSGEGRGYHQIFNRYDRCCYRNTLGTLYEAAVSDAISNLGPGTFSVFIDETHADHKFSGWASKNAQEFLDDDQNSVGR